MVINYIDCNFKNKILFYFPSYLEYCVEAWYPFSLEQRSYSCIPVKVYEFKLTNIEEEDGT